MTKIQPMISTIMPTYNRQNLIVEAIESALNQTWTNLELIVIDDGSTDNTKILLSKYNHDKRFIYIYQNNLGQSVARNRGLKEAKGDFIAFLDSDNVWLLDKLEKQVEVINKNQDCDIFYGDCISIDEDGIEISRINMPRYSGYITKHLIKDNHVSMNTTLTKKKCFDVLGGLSEKVRVGDDYELWLRLSTQFKFKYTPEYFAKYRIMEEQISTDKARRFDSNESVLKEFFNTFPEAVSLREKNRGLSFFYVRRARYEISRHYYRYAINNIVKSLTYDFLWPGPWRVTAILLLTSLNIR